MAMRDQLDIHPNQTTGCHEAWAVDPYSGGRRLLSTCSLCVSEEQYRWWSRQVWRVLDQRGDLPLSAAA